MNEEKRKRRTNAADRIVLSSETQAQLKAWDAQIQAETNGMVSVPYRELANFILQIRNAPITATEMSEIRARYFDEMKALKRAMDDVRDLRARGEKVDLNDVLKKIQMRGVEENRASQRAPRARKSKAQVPPNMSEPGHAGEADNAL